MGVTEPTNVADQWLAAELNRIWLVSERALRAFQRAQIRPQPGHPSLAEVEAILAARRTSRLGTSKAEPEDETALTRAIEELDAKLASLRAEAMIGRLITNLELRPLEIETLVVTMAPHLDAPLSDIFNVLKGPNGGRRGVDLALVAQLFRLKRADRVALLDALDPERPLLRWRMIQVLTNEAFEAFSSMTHRALRPTFDLVSTLCGRSELAPELTRFAALVREKASLDDLRFEPAMRAEIEALCEAVTRSGADKVDPDAKTFTVATWLGSNITTDEGRKFLVRIQPLVGAEKASALETEAKRVGLTGCSLADEWRKPTP